jgi:hypothetical protein
LPVAGPSFTLPPYGLESVVEWRTGDAPHWQNGVEWQTVCADTNSTYDECVTGNAVGDGAPVSEPPAKDPTASLGTYGATPFTVFAEIDCSAVGFYEGSTDIVEDAFARDESRRLEEIFWTGIVAGTADLALPHLMDTTPIVVTGDGGADVTLQMVTTVVTGGTSAAIALGLLEDAFADCYGGTGILHVTPLVAELLAEAHLLVPDGDQLFTVAGNRVVIGRGYPGTGPDGGAGNWMVITPQIFGYRSDIRSFEQETTLDRSVNTVHAIAERTYLLGYDCCLFAVSVSIT